ncbi:MAG: hypothetical protein QOF70_1531 [Acetobacteraceae bacterium]|nr:hypothetical protein [Acetobacteraceae bacterium]
MIGGSAGVLRFDAGYANRLVVDPDAVFVGAVDGGDTIGASAVSTLELASGTSAGVLSGIGTQFINFGSIAFDSGADWVIAGNTSGLAGMISGFAQGDTIDITGITVTGSSYVDGILTLDEASGGATLDLLGSFTISDFLVTNVSGGAQISIECFGGGTRILTSDGEVAVEDLRVGDQVETLLGGAPAAITWIGHRTVDCTRHPRPTQVWPVRISAGAFGPDLPCHDLFLSPGHAIYVEDVRIPVKHLINGHSIVQVPVDEVSYYHVELPRHDVLRAEGLPTESYLDIGDRANFASDSDPMRLFPDFSARSCDAATFWEIYGCAPLVVSGPTLAVVRQQVDRRAAVLSGQEAAIPSAA